MKVAVFLGSICTFSACVGSGSGDRSAPTPPPFAPPTIGDPVVGLPAASDDSSFAASFGVDVDLVVEARELRAAVSDLVPGLPGSDRLAGVQLRDFSWDAREGRDLRGLGEAVVEIHYVGEVPADVPATVGGAAIAAIGGAKLTLAEQDDAKRRVSAIASPYRFSAEEVGPSWINVNVYRVTDGTTREELASTSSRLAQRVGIGPPHRFCVSEDACLPR